MARAQTKSAPTRLAQQTLPEITPNAPAPLELPTPPTAQAYLSCVPGARQSFGQVMVPVTFFSNGLGASVGPLEAGKWRLLYFGRQIDFFPYQNGARFDGKSVVLPAKPQMIEGTLYVPLDAFCEFLGVKWSQVASSDAQKSVFLLQFPATYIEEVRAAKTKDKVRVVVTLSNPTRIVASQAKAAVGFQFAGARAANVPSLTQIGDYLVENALLESGNWNAQLGVKLNYAAPISWFTLGSPPRLVIDAQRLFEERTLDNKSGLSLTKIRKGTGHGPVQMWAVKLDPRDGWRIKVAPAGFGVLQRARPTRLAARHKAPLAINGGFFAYDGAAVGAVLVDNEWIRLPWGGRTAVGFSADGSAKIDNLQTAAAVTFGANYRLPIRELNGWPDASRITVLTRRFAPKYRLSAGEMAVVVKDGIVVSKPGSGFAPILEGGFTLVASGGARPYLDKIARGEKAKLSISPIGWPQIQTALGGGPRLVKNSKILVTNENFRSDVRLGNGARTAFGIDAQGRYIILIADGRSKYYSTGLTLQELAATMQKLGAVDALNLDGGGSTAMAVRGKLVNRPSDGTERSVANALLVMR
ncbi:Copper amine oxidase N-terminal domain-containing protein [Abditibacterium utsteinense]|uniref:Copper amine oxidase N-terminal domain-containing protein n=2 Tax=Abditibacterium utsteinense TaxID=1960156 RepID=A0A2S8SVN9_9BACT|nr:Copper amine oxidase N-terminal domain-containing protein [Abditibacterium utsteinense]